MSRVGSFVTSKKTAIIISYISLAVHTICNLVLTPVFLHYLGMEQYGLYQMIYAVASYILILDFGIKTSMVRYISKYHAVNDYESEKNFSAHCLLTVTVMIILMTIVGLIMNVFLLRVYPTIKPEESNTAHELMLIMIFVVAGTVLERFLSGCLAAYEHFSVVNAVSVGKLILKMLLTICFLSLGWGVISIAFVDLIVVFCSIFFFFTYSKIGLHFRIKLERFEIALIIELATFMLPVFLQSIIGYVNNYVDKTVLGIMTSKTDVAVYSVAMTFITLFNSLPSAISGVFLPQATKLIFSGKANSDSLTNFVIRPGRYQFMICGGFITGFALFGKEFISLWAGPDTTQAWVIAMIIMIPNIVPLVQNTALSLLDALKKRLFRSVVLFAISVINVIVSIILVSKIGMMGAPIGTAFAFVIGYGILMNCYYQKVIKLQIVRLFKSIFSKTWICLLVAGFLGLFSNYLFPDYSWVTLIIKGCFFIFVYGISLVLLGFNKQEKKDFSLVLKRFVK